MNNFFDILGVSRSTSTFEDCKHAYKKLANKHHPDKGGDTQRFQNINEAFMNAKLYFFDTSKHETPPQNKAKSSFTDKRAANKTINSFYDIEDKQPEVRFINGKHALNAVISKENLQTGGYLYVIAGGQFCSILIEPTNQAQIHKQYTITLTENNPLVFKYTKKIINVDVTISGESSIRDFTLKIDVMSLILGTTIKLEWGIHEDSLYIEPGTDIFNLKTDLFKTQKGKIVRVQFLPFVTKIEDFSEGLKECLRAELYKN